MSSNTRWVFLSFAVAGIIAAYLISRIIGGILGTAGIEDPLAAYIPLANIIGLLGGIITFVVLIKHDRASEFGHEVVKEIKKVTWPTVVETRAATLVVIILVAIIALILGLFDYIFATLTNLIYG